MKRSRELTLPEAAARLGIDPATAYRWAKSGKLKITRQTPKSTPRILVSAASVEALQQGAKTQ